MAAAVAVVSLAELDALPLTDCAALLAQACTSPLWAQLVACRRPFATVDGLLRVARSSWWEVPVQAWFEAFSGHPRIGDAAAARARFSTHELSESEQAVALQTADPRIAERLATWNHQYEAKFGHVFLICASGKSSSQILEALQERYVNTPYAELRVAAGQQMQITELRLRRLITDFSSADIVADRRAGSISAHLTPATPPSRSPITTHCLDITLGRPAANMRVTLHRKRSGGDHVDDDIWYNVGSSVTDADGRAHGLLPPGNTLEAGVYKLTFDTGAYLQRVNNGSRGFFPFVPLVFEVLPTQTNEHFHVPLLLAPFSFSTYRGS
eukprot:jgi/Chlat1/3686/Chrsp24S03846